MPPDEHHERLAKKVEAELGDLAREGERLENEIEEVRSQWRAKQADPAVPGAVSPETETSGEPSSGEPSSGEFSSGEPAGREPAGDDPADVDKPTGGDPSA